MDGNPRAEDVDERLLIFEKLQGTLHKTLKGHLDHKQLNVEFIKEKRTVIRLECQNDMGQIWTPGTLFHVHTIG